MKFSDLPTLLGVVLSDPSSVNPHPTRPTPPQQASLHSVCLHTRPLYSAYESMALHDEGCRIALYGASLCICEHSSILLRESLSSFAGSFPRRHPKQRTIKCQAFLHLVVLLLVNRVFPVCVLWIDCACVILHLVLSPLCVCVGSECVHSLHSAPLSPCPPVSPTLLLPQGYSDGTQLLEDAMHMPHDLGIEPVFLSIFTDIQTSCVSCLHAQT